MKTKCDETHCPLCGSEDLDSFFEDKKRIYLRCFYCKLVFVPKRYWLSVEDERATYDLHKNDAQNQGYRQFLSRLSVPLLYSRSTFEYLAQRFNAELNFVANDVILLNKK